MTAYLITQTVLSLLACGMAMSKKPGEPRQPLDGFDLGAVLIAHSALAAWGITLLLSQN